MKFPIMYCVSAKKKPLWSFMADDRLDGNIDNLEQLYAVTVYDTCIIF